MISSPADTGKTHLAKHLHLIHVSLQDRISPVLHNPRVVFLETDSEWVRKTCNLRLIDAYRHSEILDLIVLYLPRRTASLSDTLFKQPTLSYIVMLFMNTQVLYQHYRSWLLHFMQWTYFIHHFAYDWFICRGEESSRKRKRALTSLIATYSLVYRFLPEIRQKKSTHEMAFETKVHPLRLHNRFAGE